MKVSRTVLKAYKVESVLVFASRGTEAKILAASRLRAASEWREDVAAWVALRAERLPEMDSHLNPEATQAYIHPEH